MEIVQLDWAAWQLLRYMYLYHISTSLQLQLLCMWNVLQMLNPLLTHAVLLLGEIFVSRTLSSFVRWKISFGLLPLSLCTHAQVEEHLWCYPHCLGIYLVKPSLSSSTLTTWGCCFGFGGDSQWILPPEQSSHINMLTRPRSLIGERDWDSWKCWKWQSHFMIKRKL